MSWTSGMIAIIISDTWSRRSWMNSFTSIAQVLRQKPWPRWRRGAWVGSMCVMRRIRSLKVIRGLAHQIDEHILERRLGALPVEPLARAERRDRCLEGARLPPRHMQAGAERRHHIDAGLAGELIRQRVQSFALRGADDVGRQVRGQDHLADRAVHQQFAIGDVGDLVAALGLVHVMGGDQHREPCLLYTSPSPRDGLLSR